MEARIHVPGWASRRIETAVVLFFVAAWLACSPAADGGRGTGGRDVAEPLATAAGVESAFRAFVAAWEAEDIEAVVGSFTADGVAFDPVPPGKFAGADGIRALASGAFESLDRITIPVSEIEIDASGRVAWLTARYVFQGEAAGERRSDEGYVSMVWMLQDDGSYKATLFHASHLPEEPALEVSQ